eukprot:3388649-Rhodomonas_salina.1
MHCIARYASSVGLRAHVRAAGRHVPSPRLSRMELDHAAACYARAGTVLAYAARRALGGVRY